MQASNRVLDIEEIVVMLLLFMKAIWNFETRESSSGASLLASSLEKSLVILRIRLIGL